MNREDVRAKWAEERERMDRRKGMVLGSALIDEFLSDFDRVMEAIELEPLNLVQAGRESGFTPDHLGRLVREGRIPNAGRHGSPKILRRDLPRKPGLRPVVSESIFSPRQIAREVANSKRGGQR